MPERRTRASRGPRRLPLGVAALAATLVAGAAVAVANATGTPVISGVVRVEQPTVHPGGEVRAQLVLHNRSSRTRVLARGCPHGFIALVLTSNRATAAPAWALPACTGAVFAARPGKTVYRLKLAASYTGCTMRGHPASPGLPSCLPGNEAPPLPTGVYRVSIEASSTQLQRELAHVRPGQVRVQR